MIICSGCKNDITNAQIAELVEIQGCVKYFCVECEKLSELKKDYSSRLKNFKTPEEAISYYNYILENNPISPVFPRKLREFITGIILGLEGSIELRESKQKGAD